MSIMGLLRKLPDMVMGCLWVSCSLWGSGGCLQGVSEE